MATSQRQIQIQSRTRRPGKPPEDRRTPSGKPMRI